MELVHTETVEMLHIRRGDHELGVRVVGRDQPVGALVGAPVVIVEVVLSRLAPVYSSTVPPFQYIIIIDLVQSWKYLVITCIEGIRIDQFRKSI